MKRLDVRGRAVVVTGASSGLGEAMARDLARRGADVVLVARREDRLTRVADAIAREHGVRATCLTMDLAEHGAAHRLFEAATREHHVFAIVSNAAAYWFGRFAEMDEATSDAMLRLNVATPVGLLRHFLPYFDARGEGGALVVASVGGAIPSPMQALYSSTKAQLFALVQSLWAERGGASSPIGLTACLPGGMWTEMIARSEVAEELKRHPVVMRSMMSPERVAREAIDAFVARIPVVVPGAYNRWLIRAARVLPRGMVARRALRIYRS